MNKAIILFRLHSCIQCLYQTKAEQVSTIDSTLQVRVDSILQNKLSELNALSGQAIIMEVQIRQII